MGAYRYRHQGISIDSEIHIPEWDSAAVPAIGQADVSILVASQAGLLPAKTPACGEYQHFVQQAGWFCLRDGCAILALPLELPVSRRFRSFLIGSVWGALLYQRQELLIHASAIRTATGAIAFAGPRGSGKSTVAALLGTQGYELISDDLCRIELGPDSAVIHPSLPRLKLLGDAMERLGWGGITSVHDELQPQKRHYTPASAGVVEPTRLARIYLLEWGEYRVRPVRGMAGFRSLLRKATWRATLLEKYGNPTFYIHQMGRLLQTVPVAEFRRPRDLLNFPDWLEQTLKPDI